MLNKKDKNGKPSLASKSPKHISARLSMISNILRQHVLKENDINTERIIKFAVENLASNNAMVRQNAYLLLLTVYEQIGKKLL